LDPEIRHYLKASLKNTTNNIDLGKSVQLMIFFFNLIFLFQPPIVPKISHSGDTRNFDEYPEEDWKSAPPLPSKQLEPFKEF
jgi:protein kinase X